MKSIYLSAIFLFIVIGCSTANKTATLKISELMPPEMSSWPINDQFSGDKDFASIDLFLDRASKENPGHNTNWWVEYRRAQLWQKKDKQISCTNFARLATEPNFPLKRLAYLRAYEICPKGNEALSQLDNFNINQFEPWLSEPALNVGLDKAKDANDRATLVELNLRKSKMNLRKETKVFYAEEALKSAKKLNNKRKVKELQNRIYSLSPSRIPNPTQKEYLAVASDYRYLREFDKANSIYNKVIDSKKSNAADKLQALRGIRAAYKVQQDKEQTLKATEKLAEYATHIFKKSNKSATDAKLFADTHFVLAKTYWTENLSTKANKSLDTIEKNVSGKTSLAEVFWMRGRMNEEKQNFAGASEWFRKALKEPSESPSFRDKITWYLAWNEYKQRNFKESVSLLKEIKGRSENTYERSRYAFWLAKAYAALGEKSDAQDEYKDLIKEDPLSFYGLAAHRELGIPLPVKVARKEEATRLEDERKLTRNVREIINENYLEWLIATKEFGVARDYLDSVAVTLKKQYAQDIESWVSLFSLYARSQNYIAMFNQLNELDSAIRRTMLEENINIIYPNPYFETVSKSAARFGISTDFIYSIMRQESSFNPQARSHMDAFGLMQLLPAVAKKSAADNSIDYSSPEDLYDPTINIPLGSAHLRELWDKYDGELILAVASYNASEKAILSWLETRFRGDSLEFIEDIPYDETRDYVKLVLRNIINYQILSTNLDKLDFPEWTLKISYQKPDTSSLSPSRATASTTASSK